MKSTVNILASLIISMSILACGDSQSSYEDAGPEVTEDSKVSAELLAPNPLEPSNENMAVPADWIVRLDKNNEELNVHANGDSTKGIFFVNMSPGWHITTRPAAIFHHPALKAKGQFTAETALHLFDPGERRESFGLFVGGSNLDGDDISYDYFLIRQGGEFLVKRRSGSETSTIVPWTAHEAIMSFSKDSGSSQLNTLAVEVFSDSVHFKVNEVAVASLAADQVNTDGAVGLRVNHALNLHVSDLAVSGR